MTEPEITVSILSWLLEDRLIKTLKGIPASTSLPLNLCLHVQGAEQITDETKQEIIDVADNFFVNTDIYFTEGNAGTSKPRSELLPRSATTPFVLMTDNDMDFPQGGIDELYKFLTKNSEVGIVNLVHSGQRFTWNYLIKNKKHMMRKVPLDISKPGVIFSDFIGSASMLLRQEIALTPDIIDTRYFIGAWDWDFCLNVRALDWKIATIVNKNLIAINDHSQKTSEYKSTRYDRSITKPSVKAFRRKWNFPIESSEPLKEFLSIPSSMIMPKSDWKQRIEEYQKFVQKSNNLSEA